MRSVSGAAEPKGEQQLHVQRAAPAHSGSFLVSPSMFHTPVLVQGSSEGVRDHPSTNSLGHGGQAVGVAGAGKQVAS